MSTAWVFVVGDDAGERAEAIDALADVRGLAIASTEVSLLVDAVHRAGIALTIVVLGRSSTTATWQLALASGADHFVEHTNADHLRETVSAIAHTRRDATIAATASTALALDLEASADPLAIELATGLRDYLRGLRDERTWIDLVELTPRVAEVARRLTDTAVAVELGELRPVFGYRRELELLILNLVLVAGETMPSGGLVAVRVATTARELVVEVSDAGRTGAAVPEPARKRGSLAVVRAIMNHHRAHLVVVPRLPGGTTLRVIVPS